jgi:hypothetical protein
MKVTSQADASVKVFMFRNENGRFSHLKNFLKLGSKSSLLRRIREIKRSISKFDSPPSFIVHLLGSYTEIRGR